mmetsp:Transcript_36244/g.113148  ORF Transcript_36244/g.113148 Transcript_36244/m.113148 type:complete len:107 (-) Transcript_36244:1193-1513(-)
MKANQWHRACDKRANDQVKLLTRRHRSFDHCLYLLVLLVVFELIGSLKVNTLTTSSLSPPFPPLILLLLFLNLNHVPAVGRDKLLSLNSTSLSFQHQYRSQSAIRL